MLSKLVHGVCKQQPDLRPYCSLVQKVNGYTLSGVTTLHCSFLPPCSVWFSLGQLLRNKFSPLGVGSFV